MGIFFQKRIRKNIYKHAILTSENKLKYALNVKNKQMKDISSRRPERVKPKQRDTMSPVIDLRGIQSAPLICSKRQRKFRFNI